MAGFLPNKALLAIQTTLFIAYHARSGAPVKSHQIVERYSLNARALEPIMQTLSRAGIVQSKQGVAGGYVLANPDTVRLGDVVRPFLPSPDETDLNFDDLKPFTLPAIKAAYSALLESLDKQKLAEWVNKAEATEHIVPLSDEAPLDFII